MPPSMSRSISPQSFRPSYQVSSRGLGSNLTPWVTSWYHLHHPHASESFHFFQIVIYISDIILLSSFLGILLSIHSYPLEILDWQYGCACWCGKYTAFVSTGAITLLPFSVHSSMLLLEIYFYLNFILHSVSTSLCQQHNYLINVLTLQKPLMFPEKCRCISLNSSKPLLLLIFLPATRVFSLKAASCLILNLQPIRMLWQMVYKFHRACRNKLHLLLRISSSCPFLPSLNNCLRHGNNHQLLSQR